jgi:ABC-2 type transport system permease protein
MAVDRARPGLLLRRLGLAGRYLRFNLAAAMEYRAAFVTQVAGMIINDAAFLFFWVLLLDRVGGSIGGYGFREVMFLWSLSAAGFGLSAVLFGNASHLSRIIVAGELDVYLLQPLAVLPNLLASRMSISAWGDVAYGVLLFAFTQGASPGRAAAFAGFVVLMAVGLTAVRVLYHCATFFWGNAEEFASMASEMTVNFMIYPDTIFQGPTRWLLHSLLPAGLLAYLPARLFQRFEVAPFAAMIGGDAALVAAALAAFTIGLRRYESGSRIGARM